MGRTAVDPVLASLPNLPIKQIESILSHCKAILSLGRATGQIAQSNTDSDWLFMGFQYELKRRGLGESGNRRQAHAFYLKNLPVAEELLVTHVLTLSRVEKQALGVIFARSLAGLLARRRMTVSLRMLCVNISSLPQAIEQAFPGYLSSGMLGFIIQSQLRKSSSFQHKI